MPGLEENIHRAFVGADRIRPQHKAPMPPLEGEVPNEREAEGFVRKLSKKTPQSARSGCQLLIAE